MLGRSESSTDRSTATAPVGELQGGDPLAQCKVDLDRFVADVRDQLHRMRQTLEYHRSPAATTADDVLSAEATAPIAAEPRDSEAAGSIAPQPDYKITTQRQLEAVTAQPGAVSDRDALPPGVPPSLLADPQDQLQSLKLRLAMQLQGTAVAQHPLTS